MITDEGGGGPILAPKSPSEYGSMEPSSKPLLLLVVNCINLFPGPAESAPYTPTVAGLVMLLIVTVSGSLAATAVLETTKCNRRPPSPEVEVVKPPIVEVVVPLICRVVLTAALPSKEA